MSSNATNKTMFTWTKSIETGIENIDTDHMMMFDLIGKIKDEIASDAASETIRNIKNNVSALREYTDRHFTAEERFMNTFAYDDIDLHRRAHTLFKEKIAEIDGGLLKNDPRGWNLVGFLYDWLTGHIRDVDQAMVAKFNGTENSLEFQNMQTTTVINNAFLVAERVEKLSAQFKHETNPVLRSKLRRTINLSSENLINLVSLADTRVQQFGCPVGERTKLNGIRIAVQSSACTLAETVSRKIIKYGDALLADHSSITLGCGTVMRNWINAVSMLIELGVRNPNSITHGTFELFVKAFQIANEVCELEKNNSKLAVFGQEDRGEHKEFQLPESFSIRAASQGELLASSERLLAKT